MTKFLSAFKNEVSFEENIDDSFDRVDNTSYRF